MEPLLYIDQNLRGLARWLRFLGFDTEVASGGRSDEDLLAQAKAEGRLLITRDRDLFGRAGVFWLSENTTREQLTRVLAEIGRPDEARWFSRCTVCNEPLHEISREGVPGEFDRYWRCNACERTYWRGSHYDRAKKFLGGA